jgi:hypothetical protein
VQTWSASGRCIGSELKVHDASSRLAQREKGMVVERLDGTWTNGVKAWSNIPAQPNRLPPGSM